MNRLLHSKTAIDNKEYDIVSIPPGFLFFRGLKVDLKELIYPINHQSNIYKNQPIFLSSVDVAIFYACKHFIKVTIPSWNRNEVNYSNVFEEFIRSTSYAVLCYTNNKPLTLLSLNSFSNYNKIPYDSYRAICEPNESIFYTFERGINYVTNFTPIQILNSINLQQWYNKHDSLIEKVINTNKSQLSILDKYFISSNTDLNSSCTFCQIISGKHHLLYNPLPTSYGIALSQNKPIAYCLKPLRSREEPFPFERILIYGADHLIPTMNDFKGKAPVDVIFPKEEARGAALYYNSNSDKLKQLLDAADFLIQQYIIAKYKDSNFTQIQPGTDSVCDIEDALKGKKYILWVHALVNSIPHLHIHGLIIPQKTIRVELEKSQTYRELFTRNKTSNGEEYCVMLDQYRQFCIINSNLKNKPSDKFDYNHYNLESDNKTTLKNLTKIVTNEISSNLITNLNDARKAYFNYTDFNYTPKMEEVEFHKKVLRVKKGMNRICDNEKDKAVLKDIEAMKEFDGLIGFEMPLLYNKKLTKQHQEILLSNPSKLIEVPNHIFSTPSINSKIKPYLFCLFIQLNNQIKAGAGKGKDQNSIKFNDDLLFKKSKSKSEDNKYIELDYILELKSLDILGHTSILRDKIKPTNIENFGEMFKSFNDKINTIKASISVNESQDTKFKNVLDELIDINSFTLMQQIFMLNYNQECEYNFNNKTSDQASLIIDLDND